jgi:drug/metabolite transporter (DMT)-like permease
MLCWGAAYVPSAWLVDDLAPFTAAGLRLGLGGMVVLVILRARGMSTRPGVGLGVVGWLALTQTVIFYGATFWGIEHAGAGIAAVLANTDPLFVAGFGYLIGESLVRRQWIGLGVGFLGAAVVVFDGAGWPPRLSVDALVVIAGSFAWGIGTITAARGVRGRGSPVPLAGWQMTAGGLVLTTLGMAIETPGDGVGASTLTLVAGLALIGSAIPLVLFYVALTQAPAGEVSAWFFLVPVVGVLSAWPLLGETPTPRLGLGMAAVSAGLWLVLGRRRTRRLVRSAESP